MAAIPALDGAAARGKRCGPSRRKRKDKCKADPQRNRQVCGLGRMCAAGRCAGFNATCPTGANRCAGAETACVPAGAGVFPDMQDRAVDAIDAAFDSAAG